MSASRFWTITNSEIKITKGGGGSKPKKPKGGGGGGGRGDKGGGWTGRGKGGPGGGGSSGPDIDARLEVINVSDHAGQEFIVVTQINGVDLSEFSFIDIQFVNITTSGSGSNTKMRMQVSADGGSTWLTGNKEIRTNTTNGFIGVANEPIIFGGAAPFDCAQFITGMNTATPTFVNTNEIRAGMSAPNVRSFMTSGAAVHNALRFQSKSDGNVRFNAGTIEMIGYRTPKADLQSWDLADTNQSSITVSIPSGHTICNIYAVGVGKSIKERIRVTASVAGTRVAGATDYRSLALSFLLDDTFDFGNHNFTSADDTDVYGHMAIWGLNTAVPLYFQGEWMTADSAFPTEMRYIAGILKKTVSYSEIQIFVNSGTMNAGFIYVQTHNPATTILQQIDNGPSPSAAMDLAGLNKDNAGAIVISSFDGTSASNGLLRVKVMIDGTPDEDANDYVRHQVNVSNHSVSTTTGGMSINPNGAGTTQRRGGSVFVGIPYNVRSHMLGGWDYAGTNEWYEAAIRDARQEENGIRLLSTGGNLTAGIQHVVGYKL